MDVVQKVVVFVVPCETYSELVVTTVVLTDEYAAGALEETAATLDEDTAALELLDTGATEDTVV